MKNIQFVTGIHGDEPIPVLALASCGVEQIVANPRALSLGRRFVDVDMNKSFGKRGRRYEEVRAREIFAKIDRRKKFIDLHTFSAESEPFVVIVDLKMLGFARKLGFKHIVHMKHNIKKGGALIDHCDGVSVEVGKHNDFQSFKKTVELVEIIKKGNERNEGVKLYEVFGIIDNPGRYINFKKDTNGFIPVLAGEKAYNFYGLKARMIEG